MYYEFYIDQFFLEHLLVDYLLIVTASMLGRQKLSYARMAAGSAAAAAVMTALVCLGLPEFYFCGMLAAGAVLFAGRGRRELLKGLFFLLLTTVCFGGVLEMLLGMFGIPLLAAAVPGLLLIRLAGDFLSRQKVLRESLVTVQLQWEERTETLRGMIDTGNRLEEPLTGRPVSIVEASAVGRLLGLSWEKRRGFYLIPYHSIGTSQGWLRGVTIDRMTVELSEGKAVIKRPVLAIYEGRLSAKKQFHIILHPLHARPGAVEDHAHAKLDGEE